LKLQEIFLKPGTEYVHMMAFDKIFLVVLIRADLEMAG
jgi:hypothetical protein